MHDDLHAFLVELTARDFRYGETDCALVLGEWWARRHGADPACHLRGTYHDDAGCEAVLAAGGQLPRLVARLARSVGAARTSEPQPGDVAVVRMLRTWWGAIMTPSGKWAIKSGGGLYVTQNCRVVAAWSIG